MLDYEWNTHLLSGDDHVSSDPSDDHHRHFYDPFTDPTHLLPQNQTQMPTFQNHPQFTPLHYYDPTQLLNHDPSHYIMVPKPEPEFGFRDPNRIGLNLGGRTYFSSAESDFVNRLYRRSRPMEGGSGNVVARCQAEGCCADLTHAKHYHRRHKVCEFHSKASAVVAAGITQRFCQQCSRFHLLTEFDNGKRSCRKRLADHNRRRRKSNSQANTNQEQPQHQQQTPNSNSENAFVVVDSPSDNNLTRSPQDSGTQSTSSVTMAISPPRFSLDCFRQRSYQAAAAATSSPSTSSLFFSNG